MVEYEVARRANAEQVEASSLFLESCEDGLTLSSLAEFAPAVESRALQPKVFDKRMRSKRDGARASEQRRARDAIPHGISLTHREVQVLYWCAQGKSDWQIGQILHIAAKTVNYHAENAKKKLGVATRVQAAVIADRAGLLEMPKST